MTRIRPRGEAVRRYIIENIDQNPSDIGRVASEYFHVSRQAINVHLQRLVEEGTVHPSGKTRNRIYKLAPLVRWFESFDTSADPEEDVVWRNSVAPVLGAQPENVADIWRYGFTEMFNNAKDHSSGTHIGVYIERTAANTVMQISDNGIGIFKKIQLGLGLLDERHAIFELAKGKVTTDPARHSGEGIFFTSRMFDRFDIVSGGVRYSHEFGVPWDWVIERPDAPRTVVFLKLNNHTSRTEKKIFDQVASGEDYGFTKTIVPVALAQYGNDKLVSRSQAKRVLARVELFKSVIFDFKEVPTIGQAFADEIFRVFQNQHPDIKLYQKDANTEVLRMIERVKTGASIEEPVTVETST